MPRQENISQRQELPVTIILELDLFDVQGIDFMVPFLSSYGMKYFGRFLLYFKVGGGSFTSEQ